jgi:hypothetical protein
MLGAGVRMNDFLLCEKKDCWCMNPTEANQITITIPKQTAIELAKFTATYAPLVKEVALACQVALQRVETISTKVGSN